MTDLAKLKEALAMIEASAGPLAKADAQDWADRVYPPDEGVGLAATYLIRALQGDLNAVTALIEREMPNLSWSVEKRNSLTSVYVAKIWNGPIDGWDCIVRTSPVLALLAAYFRAKIAEAEQETADD